MAQGSEVYSLAGRPDFGGRCQLIALQYAVNWVFSEDPATVNHTNRLAFAVKVTLGTVTADTLAKIVLTDAAIQAAALADISNGGAAVADADIDSRLQGMWNTMANAGL